MAKEKYQFRVKNASGLYYYMDGDTLLTSSDPVSIPQSVDSWNEMQLGWKRDELHKGIIRKYAPEQFRFVNDIAKILRILFNTQGNGEAKAWLEVYMLKSTDLLYYLLGSFQINFTNHRSEQNYVDELLIEGGLIQKLKAFDSTPFSIELPNPDEDEAVEIVNMDGILLEGKYVYLITPKIDSLAFWGSSGGDGGTIPAIYFQQEGRLPFGVDNFLRVSTEQWPGGDFDSSYLFKVQNPYLGKVKVTYTAEIVGLDPDVTDVQVWVQIRGKKPTVSVLWEASIGSIDISGGIASVFDFTGEMPSYFLFGQENYIHVYLRVYGPGPDAETISFKHGENPGTIELLYKHKFAPTNVRTITQYNLFKKLVGKITGNEIAPPASSLLLAVGRTPDDSVYNLNPADTMFTCGDALRGLPTPEGIALGDTNPQIVTSMEDFAKHGLSTLCAGIGVEVIGGTEKVVFEHLSHFFQKDYLMIDLGENISDFEMTLYDKYRCNSFRAGYKDITIDDVNGRYDFAGEVTYKTAIEQTLNDGDFSSPYISSCYSAEFTRINLSNKKTTDSKNDNEVFVLQTIGTDDEPGTVRALDRNHVITAGIPSEIAETVFNVPFSPYRNISRLTPLLASAHDGTIFYAATQTSNKKNSALVSRMYGGSDFSERGDVILLDTNKIYKPYLFKFRTPAKIELNEIMSTNPYGVIRIVVVRGNKRAVLEGFVEDAYINPTTRESYNFHLLCSPNIEIPSWL